MRITTKKGDKGKTDLFKGPRVYKDNLQVEIFGNIDELNSYLGLLKAQSKRRKIKNIVEGIQKDLFLIGSEIGLEPKYMEKLDKKTGKAAVRKVEKLIEGLERKIKVKKDFYLPGQTVESAIIDIARVIARRAERRVVSLSRRKPLKNKNILIYLNRLSDFLFLLARSSEKR